MIYFQLDQYFITVLSTYKKYLLQVQAHFF